ncbi:HTH-type transcriptional repressor CytR [Paenibacillus solanacearum]|uniref:HTH-type transcriptional repressor CytR n=1 Tax=Paenibacillus solanacearum TaxID=2048548 RepID=A0A916NPJ4_9BACL|nr:LacI family DNA-binding transcriptional regulator [Paenibacillus solanacearum]CAG7615092.1 HTH-type transcriptional repressor CytR [Paenibacillus solanacearum]
MSSVKEVAARANVSVATVSRVLNHDPSVKAVNRQKVMRAIEELQYKPNVLAKNLRKQSSNTIAMVMPTIANPFYAGIVRGAQEAIRNSGYHMILGTTGWQADTYENMLSTSQVDGIIILSSWANKKVIQKLNENYPVVMCNEYFDDIHITYVAIDNRKAGYDAACELIRRGCRNIVYITGSKKSSSVGDRLTGYKEALSEAGIDFRPELIVKPHQGNGEDGQLVGILNELVDQGIAIDGLLTHSDLMAAFVLKGIRDKAIRLAEEVGMISFDGTFLTEISNPGVTAIVQPAYELGFSSVKLLLQKIQNKEINTSGRHILDHQLVVRET